MSPTIVAIILVAVTIASAFYKRLPTQFILCIVPVICGLVLGFNITELGDMIMNQVSTAMKSAGYMILFAMIYFTMLGETGMFDTLIKSFLKLSHGKLNVYLVMIITSVIAAMGMLTATVATAYLIVFPIMLPIYKKMKFDHASAMIIAQTAIAGMCFVPWGIAVVNSSVFAGVDPMELSRRLVPEAICFIPAIILQWIYFGYVHKKQGGLMTIDWSAEESKTQDEKQNEMARPKLFWFNLILFIAVIVMLVKSVMPSYMIFILASALTILVDYPKGGDQKKLISKAGGRFFNTIQQLIGISFFIGGVGDYHRIQRAGVPHQIYPHHPGDVHGAGDPLHSQQDLQFHVPGADLRGLQVRSCRNGRDRSLCVQHVPGHRFLALYGDDPHRYRTFGYGCK